MKTELVKIIEIPTHAIEEGWIRARIEKTPQGEHIARVVWPERDIEEAQLISLELKALAAYHMGDNQE